VTKVSIVTVCFNSAKTIAQTLASVANQLGVEQEHIIVDGGSTDATMTIVRELGSTVSRSISEPDRGIYDAMNKGLDLATGDLIAFLNSDDRYADANVLAEVVAAFDSGRCDFVYGDLQMINNDGQVVRHWKTGDIPATGLAGTQIPHPVLFIRRQLLSQLKPAFDPSYRISADLKQQLILINKMRAKGVYVRRPLALMSMGGASTAHLSGYMAGWRETVRAYNEIFGGGGWWFTAKKVTSKVSSLRRLR
jgi:glycosyltransferase involved in cell wall biosynthesis